MSHYLKKELLNAIEKLHESERKLQEINEEYEAINEELRQTNDGLIAAKEKAEESEEKYRALYNNAPLSYQSLDENGCFIDINPMWLKTLGYERGEVIGKWYGDFLHPDYVEHFRKNFPAFKKRGYISDVQFKLRRKDNTYIYVSFEGCIGYTPEGDFKQTYCVFKDITEQKQAEEALRKSEDLLNESQRLSKVGGWAWDVETQAMYWTDEAYRIHDFTPEEMEPGSAELIDRSIECYEPEDRPVVLAAFHRCMERGEPYDLELPFTTAIGRRIWIRTTARPILENRKVTRVIGNIMDITDRKQTEQKLIVAKEKAEESDRLKSAFLANMSHEIRTPMNGILGFANLLKKPDLKNENQQKYIGIIEKSGKRMLNIINDIIDISRIEAGLMKLDMKKTNVIEQIQYICTFFKPEAEAKKLKLSFKTPLTATEAIIKTDSEKVYAILTNLLKNAIKYTEKGSIELGYHLKTDREPGELEFYVRDTGIGVPKERHEAIFDRFIQADIADKMAHQGAGLGLAITKSYVEMESVKYFV